MNNEVISIINTQINKIENDWLKFPPQYCGAVEAEIQRREKEAKVSALYDLIGVLELN